MKDAFIISYYDSIDKKLSIKGRVASDIKIGDILIYLENIDTDKNEIVYLVENIIAYKCEFTCINEGMTCELIVSGELKNFKENQRLYIR